MSEKLKLIEVECYDQDGLIVVHGIEEVLKMYQAFKGLGTPEGYMPFVKLYEN